MGKRIFKLLFSFIYFRWFLVSVSYLGRREFLMFWILWWFFGDVVMVWIFREGFGKGFFFW